MKTGNLV